MLIQLIKSSMHQNVDGTTTYHCIGKDEEGKTACISLRSDSEISELLYCLEKKFGEDE